MKIGCHSKMKKFFIHIFLIITIVCSIVGCGSGRKISDKSGTYQNSFRMELIESKNFTLSQIDSVIRADTLEVYSEWHKSYLKSYDSGKGIEQRLFIKKQNDNVVVNYSTTHIEDIPLYTFKKVKYIYN